MFPLLIQVDFLCKEAASPGVCTITIFARNGVLHNAACCLLRSVCGKLKVRILFFLAEFDALFTEWPWRVKRLRLWRSIYIHNAPILGCYLNRGTHIFTILLPKTCVIFVTKLSPLLCNIFHFQRSKQKHFWACVPMHWDFSSFMATLSCTSMKLFQLSLIPIPAFQMCRLFLLKKGGKTW